ncbi:unnamed protein product [Closterium sp. Naga37s-1]|nr:unnamed protein product [Closterium sp. Naga37s-1]
MAAQEDLWEHMLCASVYEGKWIPRDFPQENHVTVMAIEDFYHRSSNCARTVRPKEFTIISAAFSRAAQAVMDVPCPPPSLSSASSLVDLLFGFSPVVLEDSDFHRSANMHRSDNHHVPAAASAAPLQGAWAMRQAPSHDHFRPLVTAPHAPHEPVGHIAARSYAIPHNLPAGAVLLQQHVVAARPEGGYLTPQQALQQGQQQQIARYGQQLPFSMHLQQSVPVQQSIQFRQQLGALPMQVLAAQGVLAPPLDHRSRYTRQ